MSELSSDDLRILFRETPTAIVLVDSDGRIRHLNGRASELFGYRARDLIGEEVETLVPPELRERHRAHREEYLREPARRPMGVGLELAGVRSDGTRIPLEISLSPVELEEGFRVMAAVRDISDRKELRSWGMDALEAAEEERLRIAHELHDDLAQRLAALQVVSGLVDRSEGEGREALVGRLRDDLRVTSEKLRELIRGLRPPSLADLGLSAAIRRELQRQLEDTAIEGRFETDGVGTRPDRRVELTVFRVAQEAVRNAVRHAEPSTVVVRLEADSDGTMRLEVADDGRGFDVAAVREQGDRFGLIGMRERCSAVGGRFGIESELGEGTRVRAVVPRG